MKRTLAVLLSILQAVQASAGLAVQAPVQAPVGGIGVTPVPGGAMAPLSAPTAALGLTLAAPAGPSLVLPVLPSAAPQAARMAAALAVPAAAAPAVQASAAVPAAAARPVLAAPQAVAETASPALRAALQGAAPAAPGAKSAAASPAKGLDLPAMSPDVPAEASKANADESFAALLGQRLAHGAGDVTGPAVSVAAELSGRARNGALERPEPSAPAAKAEPAAPAPAPASVSVWSRPAVRKAALAAGVVGALAALPFLAPYTGMVAAAGSLILGVIGIPQIVKNARAGREGTKDLTVASPLIWFAAAVLLSAVSVGQGSSVWWNAVNLLGVGESATVVGQLLWHKRDAKANRLAAATAAAVLAPLPLMAAGLIFPTAAWLSAAFTAAMSLLWVLNWPQVKKNNALWRAEHRTPEGIAPLYPILVVLGSFLHLYAAVMGGDLRWALNAVIAIVTTGMVLGQLYAPRATNAVLGPLVKASDKVLGVFARPSPIDAAFAGAELSRFAGVDSAARLAAMTERAKALPGRSVIYLEAPTAAGKSTLAQSLNEGLGRRIRSLEVDRYFKNIASVPRDANGQPDFDRPDAMLLERVASDIRTLLAGGRIELPRHDMATGRTSFDSGEFMELKADEVLVVDSIFASHPLLRAAAQGRPSLDVYLDAPSVVRLARRLARDKVARGKPVLDNLRGWARILADEKAYIKPLEADADLVLNLVGAEELAGLKAAYAKLLAEETDPAAARLMADMIRASLQADGALPSR